MAFSEKFEDALLLVAEKVDGNQYLTAIKNAFTAYMPFILSLIHISWGKRPGLFTNRQTNREDCLWIQSDPSSVSE